uniref:Uncharacterized protein n=1 Tax=Setaria italica TaxID=4555 RepID=K3XSQ1_SETIT
MSPIGALRSSVSDSRSPPRSTAPPRLANVLNAHRHISRGRGRPAHIGVGPYARRASAGRDKVTYPREVAQADTCMRRRPPAVGRGSRVRWPCAGAAAGWPAGSRVIPAPPSPVPCSSCSVVALHRCPTKQKLLGRSREPGSFSADLAKETRARVLCTRQLTVHQLQKKIEVSRETCSVKLRRAVLVSAG